MRGYWLTVRIKAASGLGAVCFLTACATCLFAQDAVPSGQDPCPAEISQAVHDCGLTLASLESKILAVAQAPGNVRKLVARQTAGSVELYVLEISDGTSAKGDAAPYANGSGLSSRIDVLLSAGQQIRVSNPSKDKAATVLLTAEPAQTADGNSAREQAAEEDFARAELVRVHDTKDQGDAIKLYDRAIAGWQAAGNQRQVASALIWKSDYLINNQSNGALAATILQEASGLLGSLDPIEVAHYWQVSAFTHVLKGDYDAALSDYGISLGFCEKAGDLAYEAKLLDNRARIELVQGKTQAAMESETSAADLAKRAGDLRREAYVEEDLGSIESTLGDFEASYRAYGQALQLLKQLPPNPRIEAAVWTDLSDYYLTLGDLGRAKDSLDQALAVWKTTSYPIGLVDTLNNYGDLYVIKGQPKTARSYFNQALDTSEKIGYERGSIALLTGLGESYLIEKDGQQAETTLERAEARAKKAGQEDSEVNIECDLGDAALLRRDFKRAGEYYEKCHALSVESHDAYHEIRGEGSLANTDFKSGALEEAETHCERALGGIEAIRGHLRNQDLRTSFLASEHAYYDLEIQILMRLGNAHPGEGYAWRAFLISERGRARALLDQVTAANNDVRGVASEALLAEYEDVRRRLRVLEAKTLTNGGVNESAASTGTRTAIGRLTIQEQQLHGEVAGSAEGEGASSSAFTLDTLQSLLPDSHSVLMEYWMGENGGYAWSITRRGMRSFRLSPRAELNRQCAAFRKALLATAVRDPRISIEERVRTHAAMEARWKQLGAKLAVTLFPPSALPPFTSTVLVVGDGAIESVPFVALPGLSVVPAANGQRRGITFLNEPSTSVFVFLQNRSVNLRSSRAVRLAVFTADSSREKSSVRQERQTAADSARLSDDLMRLPFTGDEAASIRSIFGADAVQTFSASSISPAALRNLDWKEFSIGHFAMHAILNQRYAELTGLSFGEQAGTEVRMSTDSGPASERLLWYGDICNMHAKLDLVVLSACDTALGERIPGEGLRGLTQAFFAAGSQRVLGTLWEVDDQATSEWMRHFYQTLKETRSPAKALSRAQQAMAADPEWSDSYYWAGFVLAGDWRPIP